MGRHVVWDWNGTLVDDHVAVVAAINDALARLRLRPIDSDTFRTHFTRPVQRFYEQVAGREIEPGEWETLDEAYHDSYGGRGGGLGVAPDAHEVRAGGVGGGRPQYLVVNRDARGVEPPAAVLVGDSLDDLAAAEEVGAGCVLY